MAETIYTKNAPDAIGPYSQAKVVGNLVFTSGQIAIDPATGNVVICISFFKIFYSSKINFQKKY